MNNTKKCKYCNADIEKGNRICPNCKKKQGFPTWAIALIIMFFIFGAIGSDKNNTTNNTNSANSASIETNALTSTTSSVDSSSSTKSNDTSALKNLEQQVANTSTVTTSSNIDALKKAEGQVIIPNTITTSQSNTIDDNKNYIVYITKTGKKYHSSGCRYLSKSCIESNLNEAIARGLEPCSVCNP